MAIPKSTFYKQVRRLGIKPDEANKQVLNLIVDWKQTYRFLVMIWPIIETLKKYEIPVSAATKTLETSGIRRKREKEQALADSNK